MPDRFSLGDELWFLFHDRDANAYVPKLEGTIEAMGYRGYYVAGAWHDRGTYPMFGSKAEAEDWIREHPFTVPSIKP